MFTKFDTLGRIRVIRTNDERFWGKVNICGFEMCWEWLGRKSQDGYGLFDKRLSENKFTTYIASRFAYESLYDILPKELQIDHLCRNRKCCNPYHLEAVTQQENIRRGEVYLVPIIRANKRFKCPHGHPYNKENTYIRPSGARECRECRKIGLRANYQRKRRNNKNGREKQEVSH